MTFLESDYLERDPKRKFDVGLAHAFGGALLVMAGLPMWLVIGGYLVKELAFDLSRFFRFERSKWLAHIRADKLLLADSMVDWAFWTLGALMAQSGDARYGFAALVVGAAYFIAGKLFDGTSN